MSSDAGTVAGGVEARPLKKDPRSNPRSTHAYFPNNGLEADVAVLPCA